MDKKISKDLAIFMLENEIIDNDAGFIVCRGYANDDNDFVEVTKEDVEGIEDDEEYIEFEIWTKLN